MNNVYDLWISKVEIPNKFKLQLLNKYSAEKLWNMSFNEIKNEYNLIDEKYLKRLIDTKDKTMLEKYLEYMDKINVKCFSFKSENYPKKLANIDDNPAYIYVRGNENLLFEDGVAIVGSRNASKYGMEVAKEFARKIADKNVNVISGLARRS